MLIPATTGGGRKVVTVTPNPALDITYRVPVIHPGHSHRVDPPLQRAGGKGLNVARVASQTGSPVLAIAPVGGATGDLFRAELNESGVPHLLVPAAAETRRSIAFVDETTNETTIFNERGEQQPLQTWDEILAAVKHAISQDEAAVLVGSGSLPQNAPETFYRDLVAHARRRMPVIIDTSGRPLLEAARAGADLLKPNHHELIEATGERHLPTAARRLLQLGAGTVLVSAGEKGMLAFSSEHPATHWAASLPRRLSGNPTGAGDATVAAAAVLTAAGKSDLPTLLRAMTAWGAAAVLTPGAGEIAPSYRALEEEVLVTHQKDTACL